MIWGRVEALKREASIGAWVYLCVFIVPVRLGLLIFIIERKRFWEGSSRTGAPARIRRGDVHVALGAPISRLAGVAFSALRILPLGELILSRNWLLALGSWLLALARWSCVAAQGGGTAPLRMVALNASTFRKC